MDSDTSKWKTSEEGVPMEMDSEEYEANKVRTFSFLKFKKNSFPLNFLLLTCIFLLFIPMLSSSFIAQGKCKGRAF